MHIFTWQQLMFGDTHTHTQTRTHAPLYTHLACYLLPRQHVARGGMPQTFLIKIVCQAANVARESGFSYIFD